MQRSKLIIIIAAIIIIIGIIIVAIVISNNQNIDTNTKLKFNGNLEDRENYMNNMIKNSISSKVTVDKHLKVPLFVISMHEDRLNNSLKELTKAGLNNANHFKAVNGKKCNFDELVNIGLITNDYESKIPKSVSKMGTMGCGLSHISIWKWLIDSPYDYAIIFEDDIRIDDRVKDKVELPKYIFDAIKTMSSDWTVLYLGSCADNCKAYEAQPVKYLVKTIRSFCAHAYCISKYGAKYFLDNLPTNKSMDSEINELSIQNNLSRYATYPSYVRQDINKYPSLLRPKELCEGNDVQCMP